MRFKMQHTMVVVGAILLLVLSALPISTGEFVMKNTPLTFDEAQRSCEKLREGRLVGIHNQDIQWRVTDIVNKSMDSTWIWIGLNGTANRDTMKYDLRWLDGTVFDTSLRSNFHTNVLNTRHKVCCAMAGGAWVPLGMWIDINCNEKRNYICEYMPEIKCSNAQECPQCLDKRAAPDCDKEMCTCKAKCKSTQDCPECSHKDRKHRSCVDGLCECKADCASNEECPGCHGSEKNNSICINGRCVCSALPNPKSCNSIDECDQADCTPLGKVRTCATVCDCEVERTVKELVMSHRRVNFAEAKKSCEKLNEGRLVLILNDKIQEKVVDMVRRSGDYAWIWIGMNGTGEWARAEYSLNWLDGKKFDSETQYSKFHKNIFNHRNKLCCAVAGGAWTTVGTWLDINCAEHRNYICEYMPKIKCTDVEHCPNCLDTRTVRNCEKGLCTCKA